MGLGKMFGRVTQGSARGAGLRDAIPLGLEMGCASELAGEGLVEEGFFEFLKGGEFAFVDGGEAVRFGVEDVELRSDT